MILVSYNIQYATAIVNVFLIIFAKIFYTENFIPIIDSHSDKILLPTIPTPLCKTPSSTYKERHILGDIEPIYKIYINIKIVIIRK